MQSQLTIENISIAYGQQIVIKDCHFSLQSGQILSLLGASGCGKSTLLKAIAGLIPLHEGRILLNETVISEPNYHAQPNQRGVGMIFQDYALFPHLTVAENIEFGLHKTPKAERKKKCEKVIEIVKLSEFVNRYPHELSGGQQQRVAIARTLVCEPSIMLFDEPFSNLDSAVRQALMNDIKQLLSDHNITAIFVTHDKNEAFAMADQIAIMRDGHIIQLDEPQQLYDNPVDQRVSEFLGSSSVLPAQQIDGGLQTSAGFISNNQQKNVFMCPDKNNGFHVYLRPHQVLIMANKSGRAQIKSHSFRGDLHVYQIQIENESELVQIITLDRFNEGDRVEFLLKID